MAPYGDNATFATTTIEKLPTNPSLDFKFVSEAPKKYVFDAWIRGNKEVAPGAKNGGENDWPNCRDDMQYSEGPATMITGGVKTPAAGGDWVASQSASNPESARAQDASPHCLLFSV
jgi:hypothetical protein